MAARRKKTAKKTVARKKAAKRGSRPSTRPSAPPTILSLCSLQEPWVAVWFDVDEDGNARRNVAATERLVGLAITSEGVMGVAPSSPAEGLGGFYLPELTDTNFRGYCLEDDLVSFLDEWDAGQDNDEDEEEEDEDEDDDEDEEDEDEDDEDEDEDEDEDDED